MVIGVLFFGIVTGLAATIMALLSSLPIWLAILLYPAVGTCGAVTFIGLFLLREKITGEKGASLRQNSLHSSVKRARPVINLE